MSTESKMSPTHFESNLDLLATNDGIPACVPTDPLSKAAFEHARSELHLDMLNHSLRVFIYAASVSEKENLPWHHAERLPLLFAAAMFHDMGTTEGCDGPQRFEVEGADSCTSFLKSHGITDEQAHEVWVAIACHTCAGIGERISSLARITRFGPLVDFKRPDVRALFEESFIEKVEAAFPRGEPEKVLSDTVVKQALRQPSKAPPATWPGVLTRFKKEYPDWEGVNKEF